MAVNGFLVNNEVQKYNYESLENYNTPDFSSSSTYQVGDYVMHQGKLYRCTTEITTSGGWDSSKWSLAILSDDVANLRSSVESGEYGLSEPVKQAILQIARKVAYIDAQGQTYYDDLYDALYPLNVVSISAVYTQSGTVYDTDTLDSLKDDLVVTAHYSDSSTQTVPAADYTLSGTLTAGTSTITVSYGGKTDTFSVTVKYLPSGYNKDGLVFFLDSKHGASASQWTDLVGDKSFSLTDCTFGSDGVVFNGTTSMGTLQGGITDDWENETIEVVFDGRETITSGCILSQTWVDDAVGISCRFGNDGVNRPRFAYVMDGTNHAYFQTLTSQDKNRVGLAGSTLAVLNESNVTTSYSTYYAKNSSGTTYLGCHYISSNDTISARFKGKILAVRIYNRKLSQAEIVANQQVDATYYGV